MRRRERWGPATALSLSLHVTTHPDAIRFARKLLYAAARIRGASEQDARDIELAVGEALTAGLRAVVYDLPAYGHFGGRVRRVPLGDVRAFAAAVIEELGAARGDSPSESASADGLPTWSPILEREIRAIRRRAC